MTTVGIILAGVWIASAGVALVWWVAARVSRWTDRAFDTHVDLALAQARHPSQRWVTGDRVCGRCGALYVGPTQEHIHSERVR